MKHSQIDMQAKILSRFQTPNDFPNSIPTSKLAQSNPFPSSSNLIFHCKVTQILSAILRNPSQQKVTLYLQFINVDFYIEFCFRNADWRMTLFIFSLYEICTESTIKTIKYCVQTVA